MIDPLDALDSAIADADWPRALAWAIETWRATRIAAVADLVDRIAERCDREAPPHTRHHHHGWWMERAVDIDPVKLGTLLGTLTTRLFVDRDVSWESLRERWSPKNPIIAAIAKLRSPGAIPNWIERLAALLEWPDDPRLTRTLTELLAHPEIMFHEATEDLCRALVDRLAALRDRRARPAIERLEKPALPQPTGRQSLVARLMPAARIALAGEDTPVSPRLARVIERLPEIPQPSVDLAPLWRDVVEHPDDDAPRLVLADALLALDDTRGELFSLQCAEHPPHRRGSVEGRIGRLIRTEWQRWLGELAHLVARHGSSFRRGMLDEIRVGLHSTPPSLWATAASHHELAAVTAVRSAIALPEHYVELVLGLPRFPRKLGLATSAYVEALASRCPRISSTTIEYHVHGSTPLRYTPAPIEVTFERLALLAPEVEELILGHSWWTGGTLGWNDFDATVARRALSPLPTQFPRLRRVVVPSGGDLDAALRDLPLVEIATS